MLSALIDTYAVYLEAEGKSPKTTDWHRASLAKYARWLADNGHSDKPTDWTPAVIKGYFVHLRHATTRDGKPLAPHSVKSYGNSLRSFCRWLHDEEFTDTDVMAKVKPPTAPKLVKPVLSDAECRAVLNAAKADRNALRDEALILFMLDTGARANEVCTLHVSDCQWSQRLAKVYGKGAKERYVPFSAATAKAMQRYMLNARHGESDRLFQSKEGRGPTPSGLLQLCQRLERVMNSTEGRRARPPFFRRRRIGKTEPHAPAPSRPPLGAPGGLVPAPPNAPPATNRLAAFPQVHNRL